MSDIPDLKTEVKGEALPALTEVQRKWQGELTSVTEKESAKGNKFWLFKDEPDDRGLSMTFAVFSKTDYEILNYYLENKVPFELVYNKEPKFGSFNIDHIVLPDGTWTTKEAKNSWKKGNKANNRALALNSAALVLGGNGVKTKKEMKEISTELIALADELLKWIEKEV